MPFSDLFDSEFKTRNRGHFSAIVRIAIADGTISSEEQLFLDQLAKKLDISHEEYEAIMENPLKYHINPPYLYLQRLERLYDLSRMVFVDQTLGQKQKELLQKLAIALGFTPANVGYIVDKSLSLLVLGVDLDTYIYEMQQMNK